MKPPGIEHTSASKAGWVMVAILLGWVIFFVVPFPRDPPAPRPVPEVPPPSALVKAGLKDNRDWEGLPEVFALWADDADWRDNRTFFAYWHPVTRDFSYHFEAHRVGATYRFREIPSAPAGYELGEVPADDAPLRFYRAANPEPSGVPGATSPPSRELPAITPERVSRATVDPLASQPGLRPTEPKR